MDTIRLCKECAAPLAADAPEGLCPKCLLKVGLGSEGSNPGDHTRKEKPRAPSPDELAKCFPQLQILELLGQGGMGMVYKARQPQLERLVALKILSPELSRDPAFPERFTREARALARLNHPNIVGIYDFGKAGDFYYLIMEYVDGLNLWQMEQARKPLAPEQALAIVPKICDALQYAHEEGIVHRDIKPGNILIDRKGRVKIADFGLAKVAGRQPQDSNLTQSKMTLGTPQYMAPEQLADPQKVDHRADIYSLGVVFYEMLIGELPMGRFALPSQKVQVDVRLDEIVLRALEREPGRRYQHASQVRSDVESLSGVIEKPPPHVRHALPRQPWGKQRFPPAVALAVALGVAVVAWLAVGPFVRHQRSAPIVNPSAVTVLKSFTTDDKPISADLTLAQNNAWTATCTTTQTFRLFELPHPGVEHCVVTYRARIKTQSLVGRAYLEMWCRSPAWGEAFSRGLDNVVAGSNDWATYQTPFFLKAGEKPDLIRLNLVVEGSGKVFIKDVELLAAPLN